MTGTDSDSDGPRADDGTERSDEAVCTTEDWPTFAISYTFNPGNLVGRDEPAPDELVLFEAADREPTRAWLTAERGSYVSVEDVR